MYTARSFMAVVVALLATLAVVASGHRFMITGAGSDAKDHWDDARATFYGDRKGEETMKGACGCGYGDLFVQGYGLATTALSSALFNNGAACGECFEIRCVDAPQACIKGAKSIFVTATNACPPNYTKTVGVWCNPPQKHFDLSLPMFLKIAKYKAGVVPVKLRRVLCPKKHGGVKFHLSGNPYFLMVLVYNVGHVGVVAEVKVKGSKTGWIPMHRNWGQVWDTGMKLTGQSLSFKVATSDGRCLDFHNFAPKHWHFNQTYDGKINF